MGRRLILRLRLSQGSSITIDQLQLVLVHEATTPTVNINDIGPILNQFSNSIEGSVKLFASNYIPELNLTI